MSLERARVLRFQSTDAERRLWRYLRDRRLGGVKFRRQVPIGPYVVDFLAAAFRLVIEVDGGQHALRRAYDWRRSSWLEQQGYRVLRVWSNEVLTNTEGVLEVIRRSLLK